MHQAQRLVGAMCVGLVVIAGGSTHGLASTPALEAFAQAASEPVTTRVKTWTRARLAAAQKRWAQNREKFADCSRQLGDLKTTKRRLPLHDRGHFLQECMNRNI